MSGFAVLPNSVVRDPSLGLAEKGALLVLSGYAGADNGAFPSIATIAKAIGKSERQTKRIMTSLAESGYVTKTIRHDPKTGARRSTLYHLKFDRWGGAVVQRSDLSPPNGQICQGGSDTHDTGASDTHDTPPVTPMSPKQDHRTKPIDQNQPTKARARFTPPTVDDVAQHMSEYAVNYARRKGITYALDADRCAEDFHGYWSDQGWRRRGGPMKSWQGTAQRKVRDAIDKGEYRIGGPVRRPQQPPLSRNAAIGQAWGELAMGKDYA